MLETQEQHIVCGENRINLIILVNIVIISIFIIYILKNFKKLDKEVNISISLVLGGGIGNFIDRLFRGYVIDYIDINNLFKFPIFNLADIFIVLGISIIIIDMLLKNIKIGEKI